MTRPEDNPEGPADPGDSGLFSQLPRTRPGTRSPRRKSTAGAAKPAAKASKPAAMRAAAARPAAKPTPDPGPKAGGERPKRRPEAAPRPEAGSDAPSGLEELAWAGIAVTAEAATLGVRLVGRAFEAARKATDRADRE